MGWLGDFVKKLGKESADDLIFADRLDLPIEAGEASVDRIEAGQCYIECFVESFRLENKRVFATLFNGVVYSFLTLAREGEQSSTIAAITKPTKLSNLDSSSVGKTITVSDKIMGATPWRGGGLSLELGLFAVKSGNLLSPVIDFVTRVSSLAGVAFVGAAKPFLPLFTEGMDLLAGQTADTRLVVGIDTSIELKRPMACAIIAAKFGSIDLAKLSIDPSDRKLLVGGVPLAAAYCVFSVRAVTQKADFGEIPELKAAFATLRSDITNGSPERAKESLASFRRTALSSPDLIPADAKRLVGLSEKLVADALAPPTIRFGGQEAKKLAGQEAKKFAGREVKFGGRKAARVPNDLTDLPLY
jgi:hypothetical protein